MDEIFESVKRRRQIITLLGAIGTIVTMIVVISSFFIIIKFRLKLLLVNFLVQMSPLIIVSFYVYTNNKLFADHIKDSEEKY